jgi:hypothetical protein
MVCGGGGRGGGRDICGSWLLLLTTTKGKRLLQITLGRKIKKDATGNEQSCDLFQFPVHCAPIHAGRKRMNVHVQLEDIIAQFAARPAPFWEVCHVINFSISRTPCWIE